MAHRMTEPPRFVGVGGRVLRWGAGMTCAVVANGVRQVRRRPTTNAWYVALGSSFAAGLGLGTRAPKSPLISQRSDGGYPQRLARLLDVPSFTDMTSSGSTVQQVLYGGQMLLGPQIDALGPDTRLITLTAGGNDIHYTVDLLKLAYCNGGGLLGGLANVLWKGPVPANNRNFNKLEADLRHALKEIKRRSPTAKIVVATYPRIFPDQGSCSVAGLTVVQAAIMRAVAARLADTTRIAAEEEGATIVDMAELSAGHDACSDDPWTNGFKPRKGASFHPTSAGAQATALAIWQAIRSLRFDGS